MNDMARKTKKPAASGTVRVDPADQVEASKIIEKWASAKTGRISMKDIFKAGIRVFESELQGA
jgi:hypothetical protein